MMVVGDQGKAILFDAAMGASIKPKTYKMRDLDFGGSKEKKTVHTKRVPVYAPHLDSTGEKEKWHVVRNWFTAHTFSKTEPKYVNIVKYS